MKESVKNKLKVAILIRNFSGTSGGAEKYCLETSKILAKKFDLHIFCQDYDEKIDSINIHRIPKLINRPRFLNQIFFSFYTKFLTKNFEIVHSHDIVTHANVYSIHVFPFRKVFSSLISRIIYFSKTFISIRKLSYFYIEKKAYDLNTNKQFISVSKLLSKKISETYPNVFERINIAYPGISQVNSHEDSPFDSKLCSKLDLIKSKYEFVILFIAHNFIRKGLKTLIDAIESINDTSIGLIVIGSGDKNKLKISKYESRSNMHFFGKVSKVDLVFNYADLVVHPTLEDTYGMASLEALAHGVPLIVSSEQYCGLAETLSSKEALILSNPRDIKELRSKIILVKDNKKLKLELSKNGQKKSTELSWLSCANSIENTYKKILSEK